MEASTIIKNHTINELVGIFGDKPQKEGLHVYCSKDKLDKVPLNYPFRINNYGLIYVIKGKLEVQINLISQVTEKNGLVAVKPRSAIQILAIDNDSEFIAINFSIDFILKNSINKVELDAFDFFTVNDFLKIELNETESKLAINLFEVLFENNQFDSKNISFNEEIMSSSFNLLMYHIASIYKKEYPEFKANITRQEQLTVSFIKILSENFKQERNVQFYADALFVTANHLSKVLKEVSGKTASQLITDTVIMEAKILLRDSTLTVSQVSNELQFSDQSSFGKYFKKYTNLSPIQFKASLKNIN